MRGQRERPKGNIQIPLRVPPALEITMLLSSGNRKGISHVRVCDLLQRKVRKSFLHLPFSTSFSLKYSICQGAVFYSSMSRPRYYPQITFQDVFKVSKSLEETATYLHNESAFLTSPARYLYRHTLEILWFWLKTNTTKQILQ